MTRYEPIGCSSLLQDSWERKHSTPLPNISSKWLHVSTWDKDFTLRRVSMNNSHPPANFILGGVKSRIWHYPILVLLFTKSWLVKISVQFQLITCSLKKISSDADATMVANWRQPGISSPIISSMYNHKCLRHGTIAMTIPTSNACWRRPDWCSSADKEYWTEIHVYRPWFYVCSVRLESIEILSFGIMPTKCLVKDFDARPWLRR